MTSAGTIYFDVEANYDKLLRESRVYGERAGMGFGVDFSKRAEKSTLDSFKSIGAELQGDARRAGSQAGSDFGRQFNRDVDSSLHTSRSNFVGAGSAAGKGFGRGFSTHAESSILGSVKSLAAKAGPLVAGVGVVSLFKGMVEEGREAGQVSRVTANAIKVTGGAANVTADQVGDLAEQLSLKAGIDDELIQTGANLLLTFKNVRNEAGEGNAIFDRATTSAVDLSVQFGSVDSAAKMLGKALNDPLKGISALGRAGVTFSDQQKQQIATLVGSGDALKAQAIILDEVESQVGGAAEAAADPIGRLSVAWGNLLEQGGAKVLPWLSGIAEGLAEDLPGAIDAAEAKFDSLVARGQELASAFGEKVEPAAEDVWGALVNLRDILGEVREVGEPIARGLALIGGAVVLLSLRGAAAALEGITGFLADNEMLIRLGIAALVAFGAIYAWGKIASAIDTLRIKWWYFSDAVKERSTKAALEGLVSSISPLQVAIAGLAAGFTLGQASIQNARAEAEDWREVVEAEIDLTQPNAYADALQEANDRYAEAQQYLEDIDFHGAGVFGRVKAEVVSAIQTLTPLEDTVNNNAEAAYGAADAYQAWASAQVELDKGMILTAATLGLMPQELRRLMNELGLDPALGWDVVQEAVRDEFIKTAEEAGFRGDQIQKALLLTPEEREAHAAQWQELSGAVSQSWSSALDAVQGLGSLEHVTGDSITDWYGLQVANAQNFADNIAKAFALGYDPQLISRLLQAGPAEAAPIVQGMLDNHSANLLWTVNAGEAAMREINARAVEMARLTHQATTSESAAMAAQLGNAMAITEEIAQQGANATVTTIAAELGLGVPLVAQISKDYGLEVQGEMAVMEFVAAVGSGKTADAIALELGVGVEEVRWIAAAYGIELAGAINPVLEATGAPIMVPGRGILSRPVPAPTSTYSNGAPIGPLPRNSGGPIPGPDVNQDIVPALLTPGEFVQRKDAVAKWGLGAMSSLNQGQAPPGWVIPGVNDHRYALGGLVDLPKPPAIGSWPLARGGEGAMEKAYNAALTYTRSIGGLDDYGMGGNASAARQWILSALSVLGLPADLWLPGLMKRSHQESGWNPRAINLWDSNAKKGVPSKGFLQTIDPTFNAYKLPGYGDIWNPVHNTIAAIRYMQARYGGVWNLPAGGYNEGGEVVFRHRRTFDNGGVLEPGWNLVNNETGGQEVLRPDTGPTQIVVVIGGEEFAGYIDGRIEHADGQVERLERVGEGRYS